MSDTPIAPPEEPIPPAPAPFPFWTITDVLLFVGLALPVFIVAYTIAYGLLIVVGVDAKAPRLLLPQFAGYAAMMLPLWLIFRSRYARSPLEALRLSAPARTGASSFPLGIAAAFGVLVAGAALRTPPIETPMQELLSDPVSLAIVGILASTIGPFFEELFFRGLLQPVLVSRFGVITGVIVAALPFALLHGPQYAWSWRHILLITLAGASFGWRREETGSTGAAAVMHAGYNFTLFAGLVISRIFGADVPQAV